MCGEGGGGAAAHRQGERGEAASSWSLASRAALRPMAVVVFLFSAQSFCGANMVNYYMVTILQVTRQHQ